MMEWWWNSVGTVWECEFEHLKISVFTSGQFTGPKFRENREQLLGMLGMFTITSNNITVTYCSHFCYQFKANSSQWLMNSEIYTVQNWQLLMIILRWLRIMSKHLWIIFRWSSLYIHTTIVQHVEHTLLPLFHWIRKQMIMTGSLFFLVFIIKYMKYRDNKKIRYTRTGTTS